jgi:hypothetical protein
MQKYFIIIVMLIAGSCGFEEKHQSKQLPVNPNEFLYKKGNLLAINMDSNNISIGFIADITKDEGSDWYGICFTNYSESTVIDTAKIQYLNVYGRKIASSIEKAGYIKAIDVFFLNDSTIRASSKKIKVIANLQLQQNIKIGTRAAARRFEELVVLYKEGRRQRLQLPDDYRSFYKENFRPDQYLPLRDFTEPMP